MIREIIIYFYLVVSGFLFLYGINCYILLFLFYRGNRRYNEQKQACLQRAGELLRNEENWPRVTTQIPLFNELNVARRAIGAAAAMTYPKGKHEIQILDDSTDETRQIVEDLVRQLQADGIRIEAIHRDHRTGYKAGALAYGLNRTQGDLIAIFDSDFVPPSDFLMKSVPYFVGQPDLGLVQGRWGHLNDGKSLLTRAQSVGIDGHFLIEQTVRAGHGLFMNFNGTAGVWRCQAIHEAGGWQADTLTEDIDLSYRAQLAGWKAFYLSDLVVPAEIPEEMAAFKSQQFRWAKGSMQTAIKLLPSIFRAPIPLFTKFQTFFHLTHYMIHPLMLILLLLTLPLLLFGEITSNPLVFGMLASCFVLAAMAPSSLYVASQRALYPKWGRRMFYLPALMMIGIGIALSNSRAILEAFFRVPSGFVRTPKRGSHEIKQYRMRIPFMAAGEILIGIYCLVSFSLHLWVQNYLIGHFMALYAAGFLFTGLLSLFQPFFEHRRKKSRNRLLESMESRDIPPAGPDLRCE